MTEPKEQAVPVVGETVAEQAIWHLSRLVRVYGDMQDGYGNTPTEIRHAERFLSEVSTAVPVVGVEEAVERLTRFTNGEMCAVIYAGSSAPEGGLFTDLRTILQALQGSSACADTHRATEQPVVGARNLISRDYSEELCERLRGIGERITGNTHLSGEIVSFGSVVERAARQIERFTAAGEAVNGEADLGGDEAEGAWIEHEGVHNPVPGQKVDLRLRSGDEFTDEASGRWAWSHQNPAVDDDDQIVAYRLRQNKRRKLGGDEAEGGVNQDLQAQLKAAYEALVWLGERRNLELSYGYEDEEQGGWQVHRVSGNRNDREWELLGTAATPEESIAEARQALARRGEG